MENRITALEHQIAALEMQVYALQQQVILTQTNPPSIDAIVAAALNKPDSAIARTIASKYGLNERGLS